MSHIHRRRWVSGFPAGWLCSLESSLLGVHVMLYSQPLEPQRQYQPPHTPTILHCINDHRSQALPALSGCESMDSYLDGPALYNLAALIHLPCPTSNGWKPRDLVAAFWHPKHPLPHKQWPEALPAPGKWSLESQATTAPGGRVST